MKENVKCAHCNGSGECGHTKVRHDERRRVLWKECIKCGKSNEGKYDWILDPKPSDFDIKKANIKLFCSSCGGKGY